MTKPASPHPANGHESIWRKCFFGFSAAMAAFGLFDLDAGRFAGAMGDFGIAALVLALMTEYPLIKLLADEGRRGRPRDEVLREARQLRASHPWAQRARTLGWAAVIASIGLRLVGVS